MGLQIGSSVPLVEALAFAEQIHRGQIRKKTQAPVLSHLLAVTSLVLEAGGDEDEAIAALLHDGPEDCAGSETLEEIRHRFGDRVARIVEGCTDSLEVPPPAWFERKRSYLQHLPRADESTLLVSLADKVHNVRSLVTQHRSIGDRLWDRFSTTPEQTLWYYGSLLKVFRLIESARCALLVEELSLAVEELSSRITTTSSAVDPSF